MEHAQSSKLPIQAYADKISNVFVPVVISLSLSSFLIWLLLTSVGLVPEDWYDENGKGERANERK
tara:strand:- start:213 stop:407 length:195 start_codon:yes stop_codon:yes gene_type:complete